MTSYGPVFARVYDRRWGGLAERLAPRLLAFYEDTPIARRNRSVLDICCGTGRLALHFLDNCFQVTGLDLSPHMLAVARDNAAQYVESGQARFLQQDARRFSLEERFGLAVSTFYAVNHFRHLEELMECFQSVYRVTEEEGWFLFDMKTRLGLRGWSNILVDDGEDLMMVTRGIYDEESGTAHVKMTGFSRTEDGLYERFEETLRNYAFPVQSIRQGLADVGWRHVYCARSSDLATPVQDPEQYPQVFLVACK